MPIIPEQIHASNEAERQLLASILIDSSDLSRDAITIVSAIILPSDFLDIISPDGLHSRIYQAMLTCPEPPHQVNVALELFRKRQLRGGDCAYLSELISQNINSFEYLNFAEAVKHYSESRKGHRPPQIRGFRE